MASRVLLVLLALMVFGCDDESESTVSTASVEMDAGDGATPEEEAEDATTTEEDTAEPGSEDVLEEEAEDATVEDEDTSEIELEDASEEEGDTTEVELEDASEEEEGDTTEEKDGGVQPADPGDASTCAEAVACLMTSCAGVDTGMNSCLGYCAEGLDEAGVALVESTATCFDTQCAGPCAASDDPGCMATCMHTTCGEYMIPCLIPEESGDLGCGPGLGCLFDCTESDMDLSVCMSGCYGQLTAEAQGELVGFGGCIAEPEELTFEECFDLGVACVGTSPDGTTNCVDTLACFENMMMGQDTPAGGPMAIFECLGEASENGAQGATDAFMCMIVAENNQMEQMGGFPCTDELVTCAEPGGDGSCADLMTCLMEECEDGPDGGGGLSCMANCLAKNSPQAASDYFAMSGCYPECATKCGATELLPPDEDCFNSCYEENCMPIFDKCMPSEGGF